jgi:hypothetical protein
VGGFTRSRPLSTCLRLDGPGVRRGLPPSTLELGVTSAQASLESEAGTCRPDRVPQAKQERRTGCLIRLAGGRPKTMEWWMSMRGATTLRIEQDQGTVPCPKVEGNGIAILPGSDWFAHEGAVDDCVPNRTGTIPWNVSSILYESPWHRSVDEIRRMAVMLRCRHGASHIGSTVLPTLEGREITGFRIPLRNMLEAIRCTDLQPVLFFDANAEFFQ